MHPSLLQAIRCARETLKSKDIRTLAQKAQAGETAARDKLILGYRWLVDRLAQELNACPLAVEDRFWEGIFGLTRAVELWVCQNQDLFATFRSALDALDPVDRQLVEMVYGVSGRSRTTTVGQAVKALRLDPVKAKWFMARTMASIKKSLVLDTTE